MFRKESNCIKIHISLDNNVNKLYTTDFISNNPNFISILPNVNSSVDKPEAERAVTKAEGPGMGITGTFSSTHNFA